jgi:hypothetical protein
MNHFTVGHLLYLIAAVDAVIALLVGVWLVNAPEPTTDDERKKRRARLLVAVNLVVTAIIFCLMATLMDVAKTPIF